MFLLGFAIAPFIPADISFEGWLAISLGMGGFCYFVAGLIAGYWADWKGATHGAVAAMVVWGFNLFYSLVTIGPVGMGYPGSTSGLVVVFMLSHIIAGFLMAGIGALGGFVGERIRG